LFKACGAFGNPFLPFLIFLYAAGTLATVAILPAEVAPAVADSLNGLPLASNLSPPIELLVLGCVTLGKENF